MGLSASIYGNIKKNGIFEDVKLISHQECLDVGAFKKA